MTQIIIFTTLVGSIRRQSTANQEKRCCRITFEMAAVVKHVLQSKILNAILHGPLQTPIIPFSGQEPLFKKNVVKT